MNDLFGPGSDKSGPKPPAPSIEGPSKAEPDKRLPLPARDNSDYSAKDIEVLEGLEPVRKRPGMYIGGTDEPALHHLAAEILDNAMDEAVAGHASFIEFSMEEGNWLTVRDNGRGIPVDPHPEVQESERAGGDPDDAAFGREVRRQGLCDLGRIARRRQFRGQRAVGGDGGRGRARPDAVEAVLCARQADDEAGQRRAGAQPPRHDDPLQARPGDLRRAGLRAEPAVPAVPLEGLSVPRGGNPLELRARAAEGRQGRCAAGGGAALPRRPARQPGGRYQRGAPRCCRRSGRARRRCRAKPPASWNGRWCGWRRATASCTPTATPCRPAGRHA